MREIEAGTNDPQGSLEMFLTPLEDFDHKPYIKDGQIVRDTVVTQSILVWDAGLPIKIEVPEGFVTDLASLPWFTSALFKKLGRHQRAAVLHDYLYRKKTFAKRYSDQQFNMAMQQDGVVKWRRKLIMAGLAVGGWVGWSKNKVIEIIEA